MNSRNLHLAASSGMLLAKASPAAAEAGATSNVSGTDTGSFDPSAGKGLATAPKSKKAEPIINSVKMTDGRTVDFVGKRRMVKESLVTEDGKVQTRLDFSNGQTRLFTIPENLLQKFAAHGAEQKLGDEIAGVEDLDDAVLAIDELIDRLYNGDWTQAREKSGLAGASILLRALVESTGKTAEDIRAFLKDKTAAQKAAMRVNPKIKPIVDRLEAEKAAKADKKGANINTDELLGGLGL